MQLGPLVKVGSFPPPPFCRFNFTFVCHKTNTVDWWEALQERSLWEFHAFSVRVPIVPTIPNRCCVVGSSPVSRGDSWVQLMGEAPSCFQVRPVTCCDLLGFSSHTYIAWPPNYHWRRGICQWGTWERDNHRVPLRCSRPEFKSRGGGGGGSCTSFNSIPWMWRLLIKVLEAHVPSPDLSVRSTLCVFGSIKFFVKLDALSWLCIDD